MLSFIVIIDCEELWKISKHIILGKVSPLKGGDPLKTIGTVAHLPDTANLLEEMTSWNEFLRFIALCTHYLIMIFAFFGNLILGNLHFSGRLCPSLFQNLHNAGRKVFALWITNESMSARRFFFIWKWLSKELEVESKIISSYFCVAGINR